MRAPPTELVNCSVATRAKSAAKLLTNSSICSLLIRGMLSFSSLTPGSSCGTAWPMSAALVAFKFLLHLADERRVLFEQVAIFGADQAADLFQIVLQVVEDAPQAFLVLHPAVQLGEHLVRIVDRRERLVRTGVRHPRPRVGPIGHHDAELERAEARARARVRLQIVLDFLVDRNALRPAGRRIGTALNVAGEQLGAGEQAADAAHVVVAVAADLVAHAVQHERAVLKAFERLEACFEREVLAFLIGPEGFGHDAVRAEHDHQPLPPRHEVRQTQAREVQRKRQRPGTNAQVAKKFASRTDSGHGDPFEDWRVAKTVTTKWQTT